MKSFLSTICKPVVIETMNDDDIIIGGKWRMENVENQEELLRLYDSVGCDVSKTTTVTENILHAFSLNKTGAS